MHYCYCEAEVRSSSVSVVYVIRLRIVFSKAALQKRGSIEPMEPPLDPPLFHHDYQNLSISTACTCHASRQAEGPACTLHYRLRVKTGKVSSF